MSNQNTLIVYYREGCHLCEQMVASLYQEQANHQMSVIFDINLIDIDDDPELVQKYSVDVPVVVYQNEVVFYHFFDAQAFDDILTTMKK
ncbi:MAG: glutaredoxin family protein [Cocleimonas sp.]|nr:glutaredoxin family protein [Cocleimonas sp.]